uniref:Uncharacterized protein n=1 Tax=Cyprinus carpio TaxID=7962 RepID=A0A8C1U2C3_CYPCA
SCCPREIRISHLVPLCPQMQRTSSRRSVCVLCFSAVWIFSDKRAYASETDIQFVAVTEEPDPLYFHWKFGDGPEIKTTSRIYKKRYLLPDKYFFVTVSVSNGLTSISSDVYPLVIQRAVQPNRLLYSPSVLSHSFVNFTCRISAGTDVSYVWNFGDGTERDGSSTEHHVYNRTGEYIVEVIISNLVSSASLTGHIFVVEELCQPPPVKNMGPNKIQVWRYQTVHLAVTFEAQIQCSVTRGLLYRWTIYDMSGRQLLFPHIDMGRQYTELPKYLLHYGTYKAIAKVQVTGSVVYSNYSVLIEVVRSPPVSVISEATNIFINRQSGTIITLDGRESHDPDYPNNTMSYSWSCKPVNSEESSCFNRNIVTTSAVLTFPALFLKRDFDLLKFTLTVYSGHRSSSSEMFITVTSKHVSNIHMSCKHFRENSVNWNEQFSVSALCDACGFNAKNVTYYWKLYLVNSSSKAVPEIPFCSSMDLSLPSKMEESLHFSKPAVTPYTPAYFTKPSVPVSLAPYLLSEDTDLTAPVTQDTLTSIIHKKHHNITVPTLIENPSTNTYHHAAFPTMASSHPTFLPSFPEETESSGRTNSLGFSWNISFPHSYDNEGDNLVDPRLHGPAVSEKTLLDLHRKLIHPSVFESYTLTGLSSSVVTFKPFILKPKSLYLLEVSAISEERLQGKSQLFFQTQAVPEGMSCQVQPNTGYEIHTYFSIFCSSGKEDLLYEYSFSVGNSPRKLLYEGRDFQHYFSLPSGNPNDDYKVTICIEIKNRFGATTKPCPVKVTVLPSFQRNASSQLSPDQELYMYGVGNLTGLSKIGSNRDIINYITLLIAVLNRLSLDAESSVELLTLTRTSIITAACQLSSTDKVLNRQSQLIQHVDDISSLSHESKPPAGHILDTGMVQALVSLLSSVLEAPVLTSRPGHQLTNKVLYTITDLVLLSGETAEIRLYNCTTRKEIKVRHLSTPVTIEFQRKEETNSPHTRFTLLRGQVNTHQFNITSQSLQRAIQITVQFNRPAERPFPILLLMYEQPTPNLYNKQNIYHWKEQTARIFLPQSYLQAASSVYLRLLNADFNKSPSNKYIARAVNYTLRIESVECLSWDGVKEWKRSGCFPHGGVSTDKIYCRCFTIYPVHLQCLSPHLSDLNISETNYILIIFSVIFLALYVVVLVICRKADVSIQKTTGSFLLPENNPSDRFLYAVTIDTGLRSRTRMTAKVHIVLYGDKGVSQTRELSSSDSKLFTCNSRNTFILSSPESLGRVWKLHLWHDNGGSSPSWYLSHVVVKDLVQGSCWFFLGQCWLAVDEGDGRVERSLVASECSLTFKQFLYLKLTEYLEDLHPWLSVYSRPSFSSHTHTQRWSVCLLLLQGYMCVSAVLVNLLEEQCFVEMGLIDVSPVSMVTGLCSALAVLPVGGLVSLVFRVSKVRILRLPDIVPQFLLATQLNVRSTACIHSDNLFDKTKTLLWAYSVFFSLVCCGFVLHPAMVNHLDPAHRSVYGFDLIFGSHFLDLKIKTKNLHMLILFPHTDTHNCYHSTLAARQRARYLRLVEPPNSRELKCVRGQMKKQTLLHKTARSYYVISLNSYFFSYNLLHLTLKMTPFIQQGFDVSSNHAVDSSVRDLWKSIKKLRDTGWMTPFTQIVMVQFILYNGPSNLFTAVTILVEQTSTGALIPSASIQSTRLYHFPAALDYSVMTCEVSILLQSIRMYLHLYRSSEQIRQTSCLLSEFKNVNVFYQQLSQSLLGVVVNLLLLKCVSLLRLNKAMAAAVSTWKLIFSNLLWLLVAHRFT